MGERGRWVLRGVVMAGWTAAIVWLGYSDQSDDTLIPLAAAVSLAAGLLAGTWWALIVPALAAAGLAVWDLATPDPEGTRHEITWLGAVVILGMYTVFADLFIGLGVLARKATAWVRAGAPFPDG